MTRLPIPALCVFVLAACSTPPPKVKEAPDTGPAHELPAPTDDGQVDPPNDVDEPDIPDVPDEPDTADVPELPADIDDDVPDVGIGGPDPGPPVGNGAVGEPCFLDEQCTGDQLCLDWDEGYCTFLNCPIVTECPQGSACIDLGAGTTICLDGCDPLAPDCREHYGCKPFVNTQGELSSGCVGLNPDVVPAGGACEEHSDCGGSLACLTFVPGGYCALVGCDAESCPDGTECVTYNGNATCLAQCTITEDCFVGGATLRKCAPLLDTKLEVAQVCIPSVDGSDVGEGCSTDIDCDSNECRIVAEGKCVSFELGCFTDADCPGAGVCELAPAYVKGICTQTCGSDTTCPGNSLCVDTPQGPSWCQLPCKGKNDLTTCEKVLGETCTFGDPVADTTGNGKYACAVLKIGDPGMDCETDDDCKAGGCLGQEANPGTCAPDCSATLECPFPATCVEHQAALRCMKRCFSVQDCPGTMKCSTTATAFSKICVP